MEDTLMDIEWWQSKVSGKFYTRIVGANGEGVMTSQGYTTKGSALDSAKKVRAELQAASIHERKFKKK